MMFLCTLTLSFLLPAQANVPTSKTSYQRDTLADNSSFPVVDPNYIYDQLFYMVTHFLHREAGYDKNLPSNINGHDEFAAYWSEEMVRDLQGFGPQVRRDPFPVQGWLDRPATVPAFNVEVTIPGAVHPEQVVVIGCHYDGEAVSTQSANDDGSGCAIELGIARALGQYWRENHAYPARTLRFVIFDAEEQGLFGSFHYLNSTVNGDTQNIVAMFNEEQNGIAYPLRFLGQTQYPLLPFYIFLSPLKDNQLYPAQSKLSQQQRANITRFRTLMQQAIPAIFAQFQAIGYTTLNYHQNNNSDVSLPVFTPDQISNIKQEDDNLGSSDQVPFTLAGIPCATFVGNFTYYDQNPPPWSYPFDQAQDTIQLMNTYASGSSQKATALTLSLALPGMLTTWMLNQPDILGQIPVGSSIVNNTPIAAISDIGQTQVGQSISLDGKASFDPSGNTSPLAYSWDFGDGDKSNGITVNHTYTAAGNYTLTLTVTSPTNSRSIKKLIHVVAHSPHYANIYAGPPSNGNPPHNPAVVLPIAGESSAKLPVKVSTPTTPNSTTASSNSSLIDLVVLFVLIVAAILFILLRRKPQV